MTDSGTETRLRSLRQRVAAALYDEGGKATDNFHALPRHRQEPWLGDADRIIPIVVEACARVVDQSDPEKPTAYLFRREQLANAMRGLFVGAGEEWECPIGEPGCVENCGSYGCGN